MDKSFSTQSFKNLLEFPFKGEGAAAKLFIFGLLCLLGLFIPVILHLFVLGYLYRAMQSVIHKDGELALPEWDRWGSLFVDGLKMLFNLILYLGAPLILMGVGFWVALQPYIGLISSLISSGGTDPGLQSNQMAFQFLGRILSGVGLIWAGSILIFILIIFVPAMLAHLAATGKVFAGFQCGRWGRVLGANFGGFLAVFIFTLGLYGMAAAVIKAFSLTLILAILTPLALLAMVFFPLYFMPAFAAAYREGAEKLGFLDLPENQSSNAEMPPVVAPEPPVEVAPEPPTETLAIPEPEPPQSAVEEPAPPKKRRKKTEE